MSGELVASTSVLHNRVWMPTLLRCPSAGLPEFDETAAAQALWSLPDAAPIHHQRSLASKGSEPSHFAAVINRRHFGTDEAAWVYFGSTRQWFYEWKRHVEAVIPPDLPAGDRSSDAVLKPRDPNAVEHAVEQPASAERAKQLHVEAQRRYLDRKRQRSLAFAACWQQLSAKKQKAAAALGFDAATWDIRQTGDVSSVVGEAWDGMQCCDDRCDEDCPGHVPDESPIPAWLLPWDALSTQLTSAAIRLGYTEELWEDDEDHVAGGCRRYQKGDDEEYINQIQRDAAGNWHTRAYLEFEEHRAYHPAVRVDSFMQQRQSELDQLERDRQLERERVRREREQKQQQELSIGSGMARVKVGRNVIQSTTVDAS